MTICNELIGAVFIFSWHISCLLLTKKTNSIFTGTIVRRYEMKCIFPSSDSVLGNNRLQTDQNFIIENVPPSKWWMFQLEQRFYFKTFDVHNTCIFLIVPVIMMEQFYPESATKNQRTRVVSSMRMQVRESQHEHHKVRCHYRDLGNITTGRLHAVFHLLRSSVEQTNSTRKKKYVEIRLHMNE